MNIKTWDLAIIGCGLSGSRLLINLLQDIEKPGKDVGPKHIIVFDSSGDFGAGFPYAKKSCEAGFLLIDSVAKSTPAEFKDWLIEQREDLLVYMEANSDPALKAWLSKNRQEFAAGKVDDLFVPRRLFGKFHETKFQNVIKRLQSQSGVQLSFQHKEVLELLPQARTGFRLRTSDAEYFAHKTVLAPGCIPRKNVTFTPQGYLHDLWQGGYQTLDETIDSRQRQFQRKLDVLLLGSGATASEVIYYLRHSPRLSTLRSLRVLSRSGYLAGGGAGFAENKEHAPEHSRARPAAREYILASKELHSNGLLSSLAMEFEPLPSLQTDQRLCVINLAGDKKITADIVVNCTGSGELSNTRSPLLDTLFRHSEFHVNHLDIGFELHEGSAHPYGCYILGPLQNLEDVDSHVESIQGVYRAAAEISQTLLKHWQFSEKTSAA